MDEEDREIIAALPLKAWRVVASHLECGMYRDVQPILAAIFAQVNPQVLAAREQAAAQVKSAEQRAHDPARASTQPEPRADDLSDLQTPSQVLALH